MKLFSVFISILGLGFSELIPEMCTQSGPVCSNCHELVSCVATDVGFEINHLTYCNNTCLGTSCSSDRNPPCQEARDLEFPCNNIGVLPHPFDCHKYYFCVPEGDYIKRYEAQCDIGFGYNPGTTFCDRKLVNNVCYSPPSITWPVPLCESAGQSEALIENASIYYICADYSATETILYPHLYICPHGGTYNDYECTVQAKNNLKNIMARSKHY